jgi:uncharacterized protein
MLRERFGEKYGPWALVTGASDGIGRAIATRLAQAGLNLVLVARRGEILERLADELRARFGVEVAVVPADLSKPDAVDTIAGRTADLEVGLLVAAAGFGTSGRFVDSRLEDELEMIDVNCRAVAALAHHFGSRFRRRGRGGIVLMSSVVAFQGVPRAANYAATKAYVQSLAEGLRAELKPSGVDVVASAPGPVHSGFAERADMRMGLTLTPSAVAGATLAALGRRGTVRPGWLSKLLGWSLALLPRWVRVRVMALVMGGMARAEHPPMSANFESGGSGLPYRS